MGATARTGPESEIMSSRRIHCIVPALFAAASLGLWSTAGEAAGVLQFLEPRMNVREGETRQITVVRSGSAQGEVTVVLGAGLGGTATVGQDFDMDLPLGVVRIPDGELFGRVELEVPDDEEVEGTEYAVLTLANPSGATLNAENTLLLQIEDDEEAEATFEIPGESLLRLSEGEELPIEITRSGLDTETLSAVLVGVPGTALLGIDYTDLTTNLEFAPQQASAEATLLTIDNDLAGPPRTLSLLLASPAPLGRAAFAGLGPIVVIEDSQPDRPGEFSMFAANGTVGEADGSVQLTVDRNRGSSGTASVSWVTVDGIGSGRAIAGTDYVAATDTLSFGPGETRKTFEVALVNNEAEARGRRHFEVALANPSERAGIDPEGRRVTLTIRADEGAEDDDCTGFCDCFIATAAWGSWMDPHVVALRSFRDRVLMRHAPGRAFVGLYYRHSPPLARIIARHEALRAATRAALAPLVFAIERPGAAGGLLLAGLVLLATVRQKGSRKGPD